MLATMPVPNRGCPYELAALALSAGLLFWAPSRWLWSLCATVEQASRSALTPLGSEGLAVLLPPQRFQQVHVWLAPFPMSGSDLAFEVLIQLWIASTHLNVF
jgi:hypothetical protein